MSYPIELAALRARSDGAGALTGCYAGLWNVERLQTLCESIKQKSQKNKLLKEVDGRTIIQPDPMLSLLRRDAFEELWGLIDELNVRANKRRGADSPVHATRIFSKGDSRLQCGWYTNRTYLISGARGVGKTAFLIATLILRIEANKPTVFQTANNQVYLFDNYQVQQLDNMNVDNQLNFYKHNRAVWVLCDNSNSVAFGRLLCSNWVRVHTVNRSTRIVQQCARPCRFYMDMWDLGEMAFIGRHLLRYTPAQLRRALILYQCFDPSGKMALCPRLVKDANACESYMAQLRAWLPQEIQRLLSEEASIVQILKCRNNAGFVTPASLQLIVQRPADKSDLGLRHVGTTVQYQIATRYISDSIVAAAFAMTLGRLQAWVRDLDTQSRFRNELVVSLVQRRLRSGGEFVLESGNKMILRPSDTTMPDSIYKLESVITSNSNSRRCKAAMLNRYMAPWYNAQRSMATAIINEQTGPRLVVFRQFGDTEDSYVDAHDLGDIWAQMPDEVQLKTPWLVATSVKTSSSSPRVEEGKQEVREERKSSVESTKIVAMFEQHTLMLKKPNLYTSSQDAYTMRLKLRLASWRVMRFVNYYF